MAALYRGAVLLVALDAPFVQHAVGALVGHLGAAPCHYGAWAHGDGRGYLQRQRRERRHGVHQPGGRPAAQHTVVVVHVHVAHLGTVYDVHAVAAVDGRRRRGARRSPHQVVVGVRRCARQGNALVGAGCVAVVGRQLGGRRRRRQVVYGEHEGCRPAMAALLGGDQIAPRMGEQGGECRTCSRRQHLLSRGQAVGFPCGRDRRHGGQRAGVADAYPLLACYPKARLHGYCQFARGVRPAAKESAFVFGLQLVGAGAVELEPYCVPVPDHALVYTRCRGYAPRVEGRAEQR